MSHEHDEVTTAGSMSRVRRDPDRWIATVVGLVVLVAGVAAPRSHVLLPIEGVVGRLNLLDLCAMAAGFVAAWRLHAADRLGRTFAAAWGVLFLLIADVIVIGMSLVANYALAGGPGTAAAAVTVLVGLQKTLSAIGVLAAGAYIATVARDRVPTIVGTASLAALGIGMLQALYYVQPFASVLAPLRRFDLATNPVHALISRPTGLHASANHYGAMGAVVIMIALAGMRSSRWRLPTLFAGTAIVVLSASRGAMIAAVGGAALYALVALRASKRERAGGSRSWIVAGVIVAAIGLAILAPALGGTPLESRLTSAVERVGDESVYDSGIDGRLEAWRAAAGVIRRTPLGTQVASSIVMQGPVDNEFIERWLRGGPACVAAFLVALWWLAFRLRTRDGSPLGPVLAACVGLLAVSMSPTVVPAHYVFVMLVVGSEVATVDIFGAGRPRALVFAGGLAAVALLTAASLVWRPPILAEAALYDRLLSEHTTRLRAYTRVLGAQVDSRRDGPRTDYPEEVLGFLVEREAPIARPMQRDALEETAANLIEAREAANRDDWEAARTHVDAAGQVISTVRVLRWP